MDFFTAGSYTKGRHFYQVITMTTSISYSDFGFVSVNDVIPDAILEIRYYSAFNFVGERIRGYEAPIALLTREAAQALKKAADALHKKGYAIKIYDTYRPQRAVDHFVAWAEDVEDTRMQAYFYPDLDKRDLFEKDFISIRSGHSRGSTVDLTIVDMKTGLEMDMGCGFDFFGDRAHPDYVEGLTREQIEHRMILREAMLSNGFRPAKTEWWHFCLLNEPYPDTYFDFPITMPEE